MPKILLLIDANSMIHRAYHALPPLTSPTGEPVGAVYGTASALIKILKERKPDYIAAAFDRPEPTFREEIFKDYKGHRPPTAEDLIQQIVRSQELFQKFNIPCFESAGFEADDIIATLTRKFKEKELQVIILTGDLDTLQIVQGEEVVVLTPKKGLSETILYNEKAVVERFGLRPGQLPDYKGFVGDPSDNVPGVKGVGPKTAVKFLQEFETLENLYVQGNEKKLGEKIWKNKEAAFFSRKLVILRDDVPLKVRLPDLVFREAATETIIKYFAELGFQSLIKRLLNGENGDKKPPVAAVPQNIIIGPDAKYAKDHPEEMATTKLKIAFDWKNIIKELGSAGEKIKAPLFDLKIAGWLLDPDQKDLSLEALTNRFFREGAAAGNKLDRFNRLFIFLREKIKEYGLKKVFEEVEMPLVPVIAKMEEWGVGLNVSKLKKLQKDIEEELEKITREIYRVAGSTFNINSSRQLGSVIFEKLGVKPLKLRKTKTGFKSTASDVLKKLRADHPIISLILEYREDFKINSTFVKPLLEAVGTDRRIRTTFNQTGTATGRLASQEPNLQNLPQESKWSKRLRETFEVADSEKVSLAAFDYSQLELRILAHVSRDQKLRAAFLTGLDAHKMTAAEIFDVPPEKVTDAMRRVGKTLNFGVVYGMGAKAFSEVSGLPQVKAEEFIEKYFRDFPAVKIWQDKIKSEAKSLGYVKNENGRRRWFLNALSGSTRAEAEVERAAINMPIQSLEADILKLAMIKSFEELKKRNWLETKVKLILTIHDELLFEIDNDILSVIVPLIKEIMENIYRLSPPLKVEARTGKNLADLKSI